MAGLQFPLIPDRQPPTYRNGKSAARLVAGWPAQKRHAWWAKLTEQERVALAWDWRFMGRPEQNSPPWDWYAWLLCCGRGWGKAMDIATPIPTPDGWTPIGDIVEGDIVFDEKGEQCRVTKAHPVMLGRPCYRVTFADNTSVVCDEDHLWLTWDKAARKAYGRRVTKHKIATKQVVRNHPKVRTTSEIAATVCTRTAKAEANHSIPNCMPLQLPDAGLPMDPYLFGLWLGDGHSAGAAITTPDAEVAQAFRDCGYKLRPARTNRSGKATTFGITHPDRTQSLTSTLRRMGVISNKHVPAAYLRASEKQRQALLCGLMDSDGSIEAGGSIEFCSTRLALAEAAYELFCSLGHRPTISEGVAKLYGRVTGPKYRVHCTPHTSVFTLPRKLQHQHSGRKQLTRTRHRHIVSVEPVESRSVRCITVNSPSQLYLCGRNMVPTHNTRTAVQWTQEKAGSGGAGGRILLAGRSAKDLRETMIEGESGLIAMAPPWNRPRYVSSRGRLEWPSGVIGVCFSAEEPDQFRGPQHHFGWCDEIAAWRYGRECWQQLCLGMRLGRRPQVVLSTTPRPIRLIRELAAKHGRNVHVTYGSTYDNLDNLSETFKESVLDEYEGTRLGAQELHGRILDDNPGALWKRAMFDTEGFRLPHHPPLPRVVTAIDPSITSGEQSALAGIITAGLDERGHYYLLRDDSMRAPPFVWATQAVTAYHQSKADCIVYEENQGGDMVPALIKVIDPTVRTKAVRATRGKFTRAEPVAALYEKSLVHHVGQFEDLEDELCNFDPGHTNAPSPDRMDAWYGR